MERTDIKALVAQLTLEEKAGLLSGADFWHTEAVERLGIPSIMVSDGPCGLRKQAEQADHLGLNQSISAVSFPTGACVACSFDRELLAQSGQVLGEECQAENVAVLLGPAVNIKRSPLCGRNFEYFSEDPYLAGELSAAYIQGVQSKHIGTSVKHFAANNQEHRRMTSDSVVDERTLREIYLPAFETSVKKAQPWTIMCCYNKVNGEFGSENKTLLTDILREEWGFDGFTVTDWSAANDRVKGVAAGLDLEMPGVDNGNTQRLVDAVQGGTLPEAAVDQAVENILEVVFAYAEHRDETAVFDREKDHAYVREMARQSMVLLRNENNALPLSKTDRVAFIGRFAETPRFQGGGSSKVNPWKVEGALEMARAAGLAVTYAPGYSLEELSADAELIAQAVETAQAAEKVVLFLGLPDILESEGYDRADMKLPQGQQALVEAICQLGKPVSVVLHCGGAVELPWNDQVDAILLAYLAGEGVGGATVDLLYGDANPSGKLAETFPLRLEDNPSYLYYLGEGDRVEYREGVFVGYRYYDKKALPVRYPFGHGLSYTQFAYGNLHLDKTAMADTETVTATVQVKNVGQRTGKEVVELYVEAPGKQVIRPVRELKGFQKVELAPGEEKSITFTLDKRAFAYYDVELGDWNVETGLHKLQIGRSSRELCCEAELELTSTAVKKVVYSRNSTLGDIRATQRGAKLAQELLGSVEDKSNGAMSDKALQAMLDSMPLRSLPMMMPTVTQAGLDALVEAMNG